MAAWANGRLSDEEKIDVSPHVLRHTFLRKLAETKGVHYARETSGGIVPEYLFFAHSIAFCGSACILHNALDISSS
jgi:hypothetical protein